MPDRKVLVVACTLVASRVLASERAPAPEPAPPPVHADARATDKGLPRPPSIAPKKYAAWLRALPASQQRRIGEFCRARPVDFEEVCGGIGPLHIPLPLMVRASVDKEKRHRAIVERAGTALAFEAWHASLTTTQRRYVDDQCQGGEDRPTSDLCGDNTPLVVAFDGQPVAFATGGNFSFSQGNPVPTDWPTAATPWIAIDLDGDGAITSGAELFGSATVLPDGGLAGNGFVALAALDANHDGRIDAADPAFGRLVLWADRDGDQRSTPDELTPLAGVVDAISLDARVDVRCDPRRNCERERATIRWHDATGAHAGTVVDVYLPIR